MSSMTGSISFVSEIVASAKARDVSLSPEDIESINENMGLITTVEDGAVKFTAGPFLDVIEAVEAMSRGYGKPAEKPAPSLKLGGVNLPAGGTRTAQAVARNAELRSQTNIGIYKRKQAQELVDKFGNPWLTKNRTHQAFVTNAAPDLVAGLKSSAGVL